MNEEYEDYLAAIDPHGKARSIINAHSQTVRRKPDTIVTVLEFWAHSPELQELVAAYGGEGKWMCFARLARATNRAPEVAKYCLNKVLLAMQVCWAARPWTGRAMNGFHTTA